jgi:hypothetical protein
MIVKKHRKKETIPRALVLGNEHAEGKNEEAQKKDNIPSQEAGREDILEAKNPAYTETTLKRKSTMQIGEQHKKMKEQKKAHWFKIIEDDIELVADKV